MEFVYRTRGTCSSAIKIQIDNDIITEVTFVGGCNGNTKGIGSLVKGMSVDAVISRLSGIRCGMKSTSCPDQLAQALLQYKAQSAE